jgi:hypothetical protein
MAFSITVHRRSDDALFQTPPADVSSEEFDRWIKDCQARWLYENPLGADGTVFELWNVPAHEIGLPLVGAIYDNGLRVAGADLDCLTNYPRTGWLHIRLNLRYQSSEQASWTRPR